MWSLLCSYAYKILHTVGVFAPVLPSQLQNIFYSLPSLSPFSSRKQRPQFSKMSTSSMSTSSSSLAGAVEPALLPHPSGALITRKDVEGGACLGIFRPALIPSALQSKRVSNYRHDQHAIFSRTDGFTGWRFSRLSDGTFLDPKFQDPHSSILPAVPQNKTKFVFNVRPPSPFNPLRNR